MLVYICDVTSEISLDANNSRISQEINLPSPVLPIIILLHEIQVIQHINIHVRVRHNWFVV